MPTRGITSRCATLQPRRQPRNLATSQPLNHSTARRLRPRAFPTAQPPNRPTNPSSLSRAYQVDSEKRSPRPASLKTYEVVWLATRIAHTSTRIRSLSLQSAGLTNERLWRLLKAIYHCPTATEGPSVTEAGDLFKPSTAERILLPGNPNPKPKPKPRAHRPCL